MQKYEKIETIYMRDIFGTKNLIEGDWRNSTIEMLKDIPWVWTEKVDGTNIRVHWDGYKVEFGGRTDKAEIPTELFERLQAIFGGHENEELFEQIFGEKDVILFGEGYGRKIQSGGNYIPNGVDFILFDLMINGNYQNREDVEAIAEAFGIKVVPIIGVGSLEKAVDFVKTNPKSTMGNCDMEGVVCRPKNELRDRCGNRIIVKIKWKDFKGLV